jgi:hypothetical protein
MHDRPGKAGLRGWVRAHRFPLLACLVSTSLTLVAGELGARAMCDRDEEGNLTFRSIALKPRPLPWRSAQAEIESYLRSDQSQLVFDPDLGWAPRPDRSNKLYAYDSGAIRVEAPGRVFAPEPAEGTLRIALVGDSFTLGAEVPYADTWGARLEELLGDRGQETEVLNFGVGGYGMDQAYLRWRKHARAWHPHVVILGFQPENVHRNVNLIRRLYQGGNPLSKPRFLLSARGLSLVNQPCIAPEELAATIRDIERWELVQHEEFYADYEPHPWQASVLARVVAALLERDQSEDYSLSRERVKLSLAIVRQMSKDVQAAGSRFLAVHLPARRDLETLRARGRLAYAELAASIEQSCEFVRTEDALLEAGDVESLDALFMPQGHYSTAANAVVAGALAATLSKAR